MKKVELVEMRKDGEAVYSGPTLPPLSPGERAEVSADMASCFSLQRTLKIMSQAYLKLEF